MDILDGLFAVIGIDQVIPNPDTGPYIFFDLTFVDWDHSLLMALVLSALWGSLFLKEGKTALLASLAVFSHFLTDIPVHNNDLALYPHSAAHLGYGLWESLGTRAWALEGVFSAALLAFSWWRMRSIGVDLIAPIAVLTVAFLMVSPWLSPMKLVIQTPEPWPHLLYGTLTGGSFLLLGVLLTWLINRAERSSAPPMTR